MVLGRLGAMVLASDGIFVLHYPDHPIAQILGGVADLIDAA